ncbi:type I restriction enzyme HsdR N-terminal domain-containing protein [Flavobacteriaceae bacterium]|nr:type I restriction enzyme HsdR N-terminal domain-containing protein [Flavobacteriaceae bacterium]MDB4289560.1 type I restriction enzyme HsdR N-terminal domain-containing protein [Flavobacteriaceae bacterium]MDC1265545.1 type I restriction enzyme HsdR N-terminal domain-containing protein [Flavobacteriaceae bacterium]
MQDLNFPTYSFRLKNSENNTHIFDVIRKKFVVLQPEEWVRQHCVQYLINEKNFPISLINVEKVVLINGLKKRYDIVVFNPDGSLALVVECKAPKVKISQAAFDQIARYNLTLKASYLMVTNGLNHYFCTMNHDLESFEFLETLPNYNTKEI